MKIKINKRVALRKFRYRAIFDETKLPLNYGFGSSPEEALGNLIMLNPIFTGFTIEIDKKSKSDTNKI